MPSFLKKSLCLLVGRQILGKLCYHAIAEGELASRTVRELMKDAPETRPLGEEEKTMKGHRALNLQFLLVVLAAILGGSALQVSTAVSEENCYLAGYMAGNNYASFKDLLDRGANPNATCKGAPLLVLAAYSSPNTIFAELLLHKGADVNGKDIGMGKTALITAVMRNHQGIVKLLVERCADVSVRDNDGGTALIYAAKGGKWDIARLLIERGADVNAKDNTWATPLFWAAINGTADIVKLLIDRGADVNAKDNKGRTALEMAQFEKKTDIVRILEAVAEKGRVQPAVAAEKKVVQEPQEEQVAETAAKPAPKAKPAPRRRQPEGGASPPPELPAGGALSGN